MRPSFKNTDYKPSAKKTESFKQWESKNNISKNWDTPEQIFIKPAYGVEDIQNIVAKLKTKNIGILITDHNVHETLSITDRAYLLFEGSVLMAGSSQELAANEQVRRVYLGQNFELRK